jgi:hypothetical protein
MGGERSPGSGRARTSVVRPTEAASRAACTTRSLATSSADVAWGAIARVVL